VISSTSAMPPGEWQVKAISLNGADVTDSGIEVGSQGVHGVEIELTNRPPQISGMVTDAKGGPVKDSVVLLFTQDRTRWTLPFNRYFAAAIVGDDGRFNVVTPPLGFYATLPPGAYHAIALRRADLTEWQDPEFLEGLRRQASSFSIAQGEPLPLDLRLLKRQ
jgi:hypothetical protein